MGRISCADRRLAVGACLAIVLFICYSILPFRVHIVQGSSMKNTLEPGQIILVNIATRDFVDGDIVVLNKDGYRMVKRIARSEGETIVKFSNDDGGWFVLSDPELESDAVRQTTIIDLRRGKSPSFVRVCVPRGQYFVLGDNQSDSTDSKDYGCVALKEIEGRVEYY